MLMFLKKLDNHELLLLSHFLVEAGVVHNSFIMASVNSEIGWRRKVMEWEEEEDAT